MGGAKVSGHPSITSRIIHISLQSFKIPGRRSSVLSSLVWDPVNGSAVVREPEPPSVIEQSLPSPQLPISPPETPWAAVVQTPKFARESTGHSKQTAVPSQTSAPSPSSPAPPSTTTGTVQETKKPQPYPIPKPRKRKSLLNQQQSSAAQPTSSSASSASTSSTQPVNLLASNELDPTLKGGGKIFTRRGEYNAIYEMGWWDT